MFTFNGIPSDSFSVSVKDVKQPILPTYSLNLTTAPNKNGAFLSRTKRLEPKEIEVSIVVRATSQSDLRTKIRSIAAWLYTDDVKPLVFSDEPDKTYQAIISGDTNIDEILNIGEGTLKFICPDPFAYGQAKTLSLPGSTPQFNYGGSVETYPIFTVNITGSILEWKVTNSKGEFTKVTDSFKAGDVVVVNTHTGKVTLNGATRMNILDLDSDFFALKPGKNVLQISPAEYCNVSISFIEKWL